MDFYFDFNPTEVELGRFSIKPEDIEIEKDLLKKIPDNNYYMLGMLHAGRGNMEKANMYWGKIQDRTMLSSLIEDF